MADTYVETMLNQWGMTELIDQFKEEGIDEEAFKLLDNSTIESLIKKTGLQLKFKNKLKKFHVENWVLHSDASASTNTVSSLCSSPSASIIGANNSFEKPSIIYSYIQTNEDGVSLLEPELQEQSLLLMPPPAPLSENLALHQESTKQILEIDVAALEVPSCKKRKTSVFSAGSLERLLCESIEGRRILARKEKGFLDNNLRNKLTHIIISNLLNLDKSIYSTTFIAVSEEIIALFEKENIHTYYIPYQPKSAASPKLAPKGKLYSCYVNIRSAIKITSKSPDSSVSPVESSSLPEDNVWDKTTLSNLAFLKNAVEPWDTVLDYWLQTFQLRQSEVNLSIAEYFDTYPALKQKQGFSLIEQDFNQLFPGKENILYAAWPEIANAIIREASSRRIKLPIQGEEIDTCLLSLIYLPYLFAPVTVGDNKAKKKAWRPSRLEIQESFLLNITNIGLLEEKIEERRGNLLKEKLTLQPFFVCVGEFNRVEAYYVVIDTVRYKVDTPLKALDITYKAFHTFNAKYSAESAHVWTFIQKMVYDMTTPFDNVNTATHSLISDIRRQLTESTLHNLGVNSLYRCKETNCIRSFSCLDSFRKHFLKTHFCKTDKFPDQSTSKSSNNSFINHDKQYNVDNSNVSNMKNSSSDFSEITINIKAFSDLMTEQAIKFICKMYDESTLSRKQVQNVIVEFKDFILICTDYIKNSLTKILDLYKNEISQLHRSQCLSMITSLNNLFDNLDTEYKRFKILSERGIFIEPTQLIVGQRLEQSGSKTVQKGANVQYIPPGKTLKKIFELPNTYTDTLSYMKALSSSNSQVISNIIQSEHWKDKVSHLNYDTVLPIYLYFDEYETGNPLGTHAGVHKLGAIYFSIPSLPLIEQGSVNNIFLAMLFHSSDLQEFGKHIIFSQLINDLNVLETEGLLIEVGGQVIKMNFCVALIIGDNLGIHTLLGFSEGFTANYFCRFCKCLRTETQTLCHERTALLRNETNYKLDLKINDISKTGIKALCVWHKITSFEVTKNLAVDIMHDVFEGVGGFDIILLLDQFINKDKFFTLKVLNFRIKHFKYGFEIKNRPCLISGDNLKNKSLKMSASEMKCFIMYFGLIIGDLVPVDNKYWELYIKIREIVCLILSRHITTDDYKLLETLVTEHHTIIVNTFKQTLKPKHHHMVHYSSIMKKVGPLVHMSSMRFESKHRLSKASANVVSSRVDIAKTLAIKNQLKFCNRLLDNKGFGKKISTGLAIKIENIYTVIPNFDDIVSKSEDDFESFKANVLSTKRICVNTTNYQINDTVYIDFIDGMPIFGIITRIFVSVKNEILFLYKKIDILLFNNHVQAYKVAINNLCQIDCILQSNLMYYSPLLTTTLADRFSYVSLY